MHSLNPNALMHINATLTGKKIISQDEVWGIHRLYGKEGRLKGQFQPWGALRCSCTFRRSRRTQGKADSC